ncbi:hypothetical protein [Paracoccus sp. (in: a-proteobacteria)]|uniref:hypothetical protein n=1 Tax=Paracoccus sp. TaxID=267 RepID=UPI00396C7C4A
MTHEHIAGQPLPDPAFQGAIWQDFKDSSTQLVGVITDVNVSGSDPTLQVRGPDGRNWTVELADRARNASLGLTRSALLPGEPVRVIGRRTQRFGERRIKALRLTVEDRRFDLFPEAISA